MFYFLDIDGVLNKESDWKKPFTMNDECVEHFASLISKDEDPHIILSSSWRLGVTNQGEANKSASDDMFSKLLQYRITIEDVTPTSDRTRQEEIEYYIRRHDIDRYIIIDDDPSLFPWPERIHLYITNYKTGLTKKDIKILKKKI